jgi:acetyl esterase/lipase
LSAPAIDSATGVLLGGAAVAPSGTWTPKPGETIASNVGTFSIDLPAASAVLLTTERAVMPATTGSLRRVVQSIGIGCILLGTMLLAAPSLLAQKAAVREAVPYEVVGTETLVADLYLPQGKGPYPAVVFIHGGAWRSGTRAQLRGQAALMAENGFFGMAIEYRLAPQYKYPAAIDDASAAVRWLRAHAAEYNIDPDRIAAVGSSAGAHLASLLGTRSTPLASGQKHRTATDASVEAVVAFNGIFDFATWPAADKVSDFLGGQCPEVKEICEEASPMRQVRPGEPPFLLLHGTADETAPYTQATNFQQRLLQNKDSVELFTAPGAPHTFWDKPKWREPSFNSMRDFLVRTLKP